jgi:hypothetical protein
LEEESTAVVAVVVRRFDDESDELVLAQGCEPGAKLGCWCGFGVECRAGRSVQVEVGQADPDEVGAECSAVRLGAGAVAAEGLARAVMQDCFEFLAVVEYRLQSSSWGPSMSAIPCPADWNASSPARSRNSATVVSIVNSSGVVESCWSPYADPRSGRDAGGMPGVYLGFDLRVALACSAIRASGW